MSSSSLLSSYFFIILFSLKFFLFFFSSPTDAIVSRLFNTNDTTPNGTTDLSWAVCDDTSGQTQTILTVFAVALIIVGIALILFGYNMLRPVAFAAGFCVGFAIIYIVIDTYISPNWIIWGKVGVAAAVGVILGGLSAFFVENFPFVLGFLSGLIITSMVLATPLGPSLFDKGNYFPLITLALGGMAGGVIGFILKKWLLMLTSAAGGSLCVAYAIDCAWLKSHFTHVIPQIIALKHVDLGGSVMTYVLIAGVGFGTLLGFFFQLYMQWNNNLAQKNGYSQLVPVYNH